MRSVAKELGLILLCTALAMAAGAVAFCVVSPNPARFVPSLPMSADSVLPPDDQFNETGYWSFEDPVAREELPLYKTLPAAAPDELTPTNEFPHLVDDREQYVQWYRSHGDATSSRFSLLDQVNCENVTQLQVAWTYHSDDGQGNIQCNPIIVDGVMYAPTVGHHVVAIDAANGEELWRIKPGGRPAFRGLVYWPGNDSHSARILLNAGEALHALNPKTGETIFRIPMPEARAAGAVFDEVFVVPGYLKDVYGFNVTSGEKLWTFQTIPEQGQFGHDTWDQVGQGANCWGGMALDQRRGIAYVATGSPKPNFIGVNHLGSNLFGNCVVALNARNGERLWHFQEIRHDIWDLDIPCSPNLVTVTRHGRRVDAVAQVTKLGNTLLLDRMTGKPLFPFRLRRAPVTKLLGERTWRYQPDLQIPEPFARQVFTLDDVTELSAEARQSVLQKLVDVTLGWFEPFEEGKPNAFYGIHGGAEWTGACFDRQTGFLYVSSNNLPWTPMVTRNERPVVDETKLAPTPGRLVYETHCLKCHGTNREGVGVNPSLIGLQDRLNVGQVSLLLKTGRNLMPAALQVAGEDRAHLLDYLFDQDREYPTPRVRPERPNYQSHGYPKLLDHEGYPGCKPPWGTLNCIDLNTGRLRWQVPLGEHEALTKRGVPKTGTENFGGPMVTAGGLVFCAGTRDQKIRAFDKQTGEELWEFKLPWGGFAPPATYSVRGQQYVVIPATGGGKLGGPTGDAYVAFALPD